MQLVKRDSNIIAKWWFALDHVILLAILFLLVIGTVMVVSASPSVAERIGVFDSFFYRRHFVFVVLALFILFSVMLIPRRYLIKICIVGYIVCLLLLILVLFEGNAFKGARRWIDIFGFSLQPSEIMKPFFIIMNAWLFALARDNNDLFRLRLSLLLFAVVIVLLFNQPDFGMVINYSVVWGALLLLYGIPAIVILLLIFCAIAGVFFAYNFLPHVKYRIDSFIFSDDQMSYQVRKSLDAIANGGFFGQGIGEGTVKNILPDSHTDFIFAAMVEELGLVFTLVVVLLYAIIIIRALNHARKIDDNFVAFAIIGLALQFGFQVITNIGVNLNLLPTKGTTLPLISYGGSSMVATSIIMGFILLFTKTRYGHISERKL